MLELSVLLPVCSVQVGVKDMLLFLVVVKLYICQAAAGPAPGLGDVCGGAGDGHQRRGWGHLHRRPRDGGGGAGHHHRQLGAGGDRGIRDCGP